MAKRDTIVLRIDEDDSPPDASPLLWEPFVGARELPRKAPWGSVDASTQEGWAAIGGGSAVGTSSTTTQAVQNVVSQNITDAQQVAITVITGWRVNESGNRIEVTTRTMNVLAISDSGNSGWTNVHTGAVCT